MADGTATKGAKKPVSKGQAAAVAAMMAKKGNGGPAIPTPKSNPVTTADDNATDDEE